MEGLKKAGGGKGDEDRLNDEGAGTIIMEGKQSSESAVSPQKLEDSLKEKQTEHDAEAAEAVT